MPNSFRFESVGHEYFDEHGPIPSVTQLLERAGLVDTTFYTEASRERGSQVHALTSAFDLGSLDTDDPNMPHRGYLLAYMAAMDQLKPNWTDIEVAHLHPGYRFAGRIDRTGLCLGQQTVCEIKSGAPHASHRIQLALYALLAAHASNLKSPHAWQRVCLYLRPNGRFKVEIHRDRRDFDKALEVIQECCA